MAKGHPTESGPYWVRMLDWSTSTYKYEVENREWMLARVDVSENPEHAVELIGDENLYNIHHVYEYQIIGRPKSD